MARVRSKQSDEDIKVDMTPMIDIVFQLLVFFIMTFEIVPMEGDFNIKMPLATNNPMDIEEQLPDVIYIELKATASGDLLEIYADNGINDATFADLNTCFQELTQFVEESLSGDADPSTAVETEVEFDIYPDLKYKHTVKAIEAVSGTVNEDGTINKLIETIKFKDNSQG